MSWRRWKRPGRSRLTIRGAKVGHPHCQKPAQTLRTHNPDPPLSSKYFLHFGGPWPPIGLFEMAVVLY